MTTYYITNNDTGVVIYNSIGVWSSEYVESTGPFPGIDTFKTPWRESTQEEIDAYLLEQAKLAKLEVLQGKFSEFECAGFEYQENVFCLEQRGLFNAEGIKPNIGDENPNRYKFCDTCGQDVDFVNADGWSAFEVAICSERDRIMRYKISKSNEINAAETAQEVDDITMDFSI